MFRSEQEPPETFVMTQTLAEAWNAEGLTRLVFAP